MNGSNEPAKEIKVGTKVTSKVHNKQGIVVVVQQPERPNKTLIYHVKLSTKDTRYLTKNQLEVVD